MEVKKPTLSVRVHITLEDIESLLYSATNGSSYWCSNSEQLGYEKTVKIILDHNDVGFYLYDGEDDKAEETKLGVRHLLNFNKIKRGLTVMAKKEISHFSDLINDNADQITADVFLQCCLFGEVLYS